MTKTPDSVYLFLFSTYFSVQYIKSCKTPHKGSSSHPHVSLGPGPKLSQGVGVLRIVWIRTGTSCLSTLGQHFGVTIKGLLCWICANIVIPSSAVRILWTGPTNKLRRHIAKWSVQGKEKNKQGSSIIPPPVLLPPSNNPRTTNNSRSASEAPRVIVPEAQASSSSGAAAGCRQIADQTVACVTASLELQFQRESTVLLPLLGSGRSSPSLDNPEEQPEQTSASILNLHASQKTNPATSSTQQDPTSAVTIQSAQTPLVQPTVVQNPVQLPLAIVPPVQTTIAQNPNPSKPKMDHLKLPNIVGHNTFKRDKKPESLKWYLNTVEEFATTAKATTAVDRKFLALRHVDYVTQQQWNCLETAEDPYTWEEFKEEELMENYPESKEAEKGSMAALGRLVRKFAVAIDDLSEYRKYTQEFKTALKKLGAERITNRETAILFMKGLSQELQGEVRSIQVTPVESLGSYKAAEVSWAKTHTKAELFVYKPQEDNNRYVWTDIKEAALRIVKEESSTLYYDQPRASKKETGPKRASLDNDTKQIKEFASKVHELDSTIELAMATHLDKFTTNNCKELLEMKVFIEASMKPQAQGQASNNTNTLPPPAQRGYKPRSKEMCFCCFGPGHYIGDCVKRHEDIDQGILKVVDGRTVFYNGKNIPREPKHNSPCDKACEYHARRVLGQHIQLDENDSYEDVDYESRDDEIQTLKAEKAQLNQIVKQRVRPSTPPRTSFAQEDVASVLGEALKTINRFSTIMDKEQLVQTRGGKSPKVLPPKPTSAEPNRKGAAKKAYRVVPNTDMEEAVNKIVDTIGETMIPIAVKHVIAASTGVQKGLQAKMGKSRRSNSTQGVEGDILAKTVQKFSVTTIMEGPLAPARPPLAERNKPTESVAQFMTLEEDFLDISKLS
ncbi:hypothetical protein B0H19DRAFT_1060898 [Mycena capillaripes]|nr:hypothetical protein B0H19DRAFT_1060898 [Mycena capillaripes]